MAFFFVRPVGEAVGKARTDRPPRKNFNRPVEINLQHSTIFGNSRLPSNDTEFAGPFVEHNLNSSHEDVKQERRVSFREKEDEEESVGKRRPGSGQKRTLEQCNFFDLARLPLIVHVHLFHHLSFEDGESLKLVSRAFHRAWKMAWARKRRLELRSDLALLFPSAPPFASLRPLRPHLHTLLHLLRPSLAIIDFSSLHGKHPGTLFLDPNDITEIFGEDEWEGVVEVDLRQCHFSGELVRVLARTFPNVDHLRVSARRLQVPTAAPIPFQGQQLPPSHPDFHSALESHLWRRCPHYPALRLRLSLQLKHALFFFTTAFNKLEIIDFTRD